MPGLEFTKLRVKSLSFFICVISNLRFIDFIALITFLDIFLTHLQISSLNHLPWHAKCLIEYQDARSKMPWGRGQKAPLSLQDAIMDGLGRSRKVKEGHGWAFPITGLTFQVRKVRDICA